MGIELRAMGTTAMGIALMSIGNGEGGRGVTFDTHFISAYKFLNDPDFKTSKNKICPFLYLLRSGPMENN